MTQQQTNQAEIESAVGRQAAEWFVAHREGPLAERERAAFTEWLRTSPVHVREYLAVAAVARGFNTLPDADGVDLEQLIARAQREADGVVSFGRTVAPSRPARPRRTSRTARWAIAAGVGVLMLAAAPWLVRQTNLAGDADSLQTAHGEQRVWCLPDNSVVHLNSGSRLKVNFSDEQRIVEVTRGQALFDVAPDPLRPFRVLAGSTEVVAIGTSFDVYRREDATVVTVVTGKVAVYSKASAGKTAGMVPAVPLQAGEQVRIAPVQPPTRVDRVDVAKAVAWTQRQIMFEQERLADVVMEFNRYGRVPIEVEGAALNDLRITGIFNAYDTESFVGFLGRLDKVAVDASAQRIRVRKNSGT